MIERHIPYTNKDGEPKYFTITLTSPSNMSDKDIDEFLRPYVKGVLRDKKMEGMSRPEKISFELNEFTNEIRDIKCPFCHSKDEPSTRLVQHVEGGIFYTFTKDVEIMHCNKCDREYKRNDLNEYITGSISSYRRTLFEKYS